MGTVITVLVSVGFIALGLIVLFLAYPVIAFVYSTPYGLCLAAHIQKHNLPKDYRKAASFKLMAKDATKFYSDLLHHRKPTFD